MDRIIGFERLGGDNFLTSSLEDHLDRVGTVVCSGLGAKARKSIFGFKEEEEEESD